ncbi:MAG: alpha/beta hydrolase-fold protein [Clostridia bacterium]|nr:alpha/beta hydrolase-fold protein [Clostridia bacterium]
MAILQANFMSKCLMRTVTVNVILPVDKLTKPGEPVREKKPFKTLYLLHGIFGDYTDWITGTRVARWAQENNLAVVMPSGENHFYVDDPKAGHYYGKFIGEELVQMTRDMFPLSAKREDTYIGGLSMGGYGALVNGLKYSETFGAVVALSSGLILDRMATASDAPDASYSSRKGYLESVFGDLTKVKGSDMDYEALVLKLKKEKKQFPKLYIACGTEDFLIEQNRAYVKFLKAQGVEHTYMEGPGVHDWNFWDAYIYKAMEWLPLEGKTSGINSGNVQ